jgi:filamentous hemagglutinin
MRSDHAKQRGDEGRPVQIAFNDAQRAGLSNLFMQSDGRFVVRGPRAREHVFENSGVLVTSLVRSNKLHQRKILRKERTPATEQQFIEFKEVIK